SMVLAAFHRRLTWSALMVSVEGCMRTTAMIMAILLAAYFLNLVIGIVGLTNGLSSLIDSLGLTPLQALILIILFYLVLGMFMEPLSMMVATVPIVTPIIVALGYDPVW